MLVFIDEPGDPGLRPKPGSSQFFVVTAILFEGSEEAEQAGPAQDLVLS